MKKTFGKAKKNEGKGIELEGRLRAERFKVLSSLTYTIKVLYCTYKFDICQRVTFVNLHTILNIKSR